MTKTIIKSSELATITPDPGQHAIFVGINGSGKSFLAKRIVEKADYKDIVVIDPKGEIATTSNIERIEEPHRIGRSKNSVILYTPKPKFDTLESYNSVLEWVYRRRNTLLYIDEIYALSQNGVTYPNYLKALYTRGRSLGISVYGCSQRPRTIPLYCLSESKHAYVFQLLIKEDRQRVAEMFGPEILIPSQGYDFWYASLGNKPVSMEFKNG